MAITHALAHARPDSHTPPCELLERLNKDLTRLYTRGETFIIAAYSLTWIVLLAYLVYLVRRTRTSRAEHARLAGGREGEIR